MKHRIYLDDNRIPSEIYDFHHVMSYEEFVQYIKNYVKEHNKLPELISFDHDLGREHVVYYTERNFKVDNHEHYDNFTEKTGYCCAKWLVDYAEENKLSLENTAIYVHSANPYGTQNIISYINNYLKTKNLPEVAQIKRWKFQWSSKKESF